MDVSFRRLSNTSWQIPIILLVLLTYSVVAYWATWGSLLDKWLRFDESLSHGLGVVLAFLFFIFRFRPSKPKDNPTFIVIIVLSLLLIMTMAWFLFDTLNIEILAQLSLVGVMYLLLIQLLGIRNAIPTGLITALLLFSLPLWDYLIEPLIDLSALVVSNSVRLLAIPTLIEGNSITLSYGTVLIADGCSGIRYLAVATFLTYFSCLLNEYSVRRSVIYLGISILLGLLTNWVRIFSLVVIADATEMQSALMQDHEYFGWVLFMLMIFPYLYLLPHSAKRTAQNSDYQYSKKATITLVLMVSIASIGPALSLASSGLNKYAKIEYDFSGKLGMYKRKDLSSNSPTVIPGGYFDLDVYESKAPISTIYTIAQYGQSEQNLKIVPYFNRLYSKDNWVVMNERKLDSRIVLRELQSKGIGERWLQAYWFKTAGVFSGSYTSSKLLQALAPFNGKNNFTIFVLASQCEYSNCEEARKIIMDQLQAIEHVSKGTL